ncbi:choice-of-anchor Q domain-containing protein [Marinifilum flexuosum]|uniref:Parallel beta helix pectate lyase-like protein n=1 Tax=Marinifilum flexuosum TaxID=1117708 RepID=A0A419X8C2_9BACT|nr:choice-of-anchor Q domain-containing protein [Marinifilum flexuosum]RKE03896.1 hypothetical protein BXY64_0907 [Marinifilum flexuosum]
MRNILSLLCCLSFTLVIFSCDNEDGLNTDPNFRVSFSVDTLKFDTLLTGFGSTTKQFKVYNKSSKKVNLQEIYLQDANSPYRLNVNGTAEERFANVEIGANDSLFVFVEVDLAPKDTDQAVLLEDILVFNVNNNLQGIILSTWSQDVVLIEEDIVNSQNWTGKRPYLINKQVSISENTELVLEEGTTVYFGKNGGLDVHGTIKAEGSFEKPVYFGSSRLEELYKNVPGQWNGIYIHESSKSNQLSHFILEDGINGILYAGNNGELQLEYGIIRNFTENGIAITNASLHAHDLLMVNCGDECLKVEDGELNLFHSTLYNAWNFDIRTAPTIQLVNTSEYNSNMGNCIVWGVHSDEFVTDNTSGLKIENTLLKLSNSLQDEYATLFSDCIFNENPEFVSIDEKNYALSETSPCINTGKLEIGTKYPNDLLNNSRTDDSTPDMGAFEFKDNQE